MENPNMYATGAIPNSSKKCCCDKLIKIIIKMQKQIDKIEECCESKQDKLIAGRCMDIDPITNVISSNAKHCKDDKDDKDDD